MYGLYFVQNMKIHFNSSRSHKAIATRRMSFARQEHELNAKESAVFERMRRETPQDANIIRLLGFPTTKITGKNFIENVALNNWFLHLGID